ncbi:MAG: histidine kinase dimerization/phospho-acceptor domain-containing protein [Marinomonas sp.]
MSPALRSDFTCLPQRISAASMFFDDRLATVLRHRADGEAAARTQFRQLLDLLGNRPHGSGGDESLLAAAWLRLGALGEIIPAKDRAGIVRETGWRFRNAELAAHLAEDEPDVASAAIARADLSEEDWTALIPHLPIRARGFLRRREGLPSRAEALLEQLGVSDRGLPVPEEQFDTEKETASILSGEGEQALVSDRDTNVQNSPSSPSGDDKSALRGISPEGLPIAPVAKAPATNRTSPSDIEKSEIAELVERIAQFRKDRVPASAAGESSPRLPLDENLGASGKIATIFRFSADITGRIDWAEQHVAPMIIGKRLVEPREIGTVDEPSPAARAFARHQPIRAAMLTLEGAPAIAGEWVVDAQPRFQRRSGHFQGYMGRMRRVKSNAQDASNSEADRIRQLLHELRTPVNALQGFAEIIQQQLFGPAPNEYRALAADIASDSARILAGFDELERLARLESGALTLPDGSSDISTIIEHMTAQLQPVLAPRMAGFDLAEGDAGPLLVGVDQDDAEAMIWRIMGTLAGCCAASENLALSIAEHAGQVRVQWDMPAQLQAESEPFAADINPSTDGLSAGLFGAGFSLRLARAEARSAGGDLSAAGDRLILVLPILTGEGSRPSPDDARKAADDSQQSG